MHVGVLNHFAGKHTQDSSKNRRRNQYKSPQSILLRLHKIKTHPGQVLHEVIPLAPARYDFITRIPCTLYIVGASVIMVGQIILSL